MAEFVLSEVIKIFVSQSYNKRMFSKIIFTEPDKFNIRFSIGFFVFPSQTSAFYRKLYEKENNCGKHNSYLVFYLTTYFSAEK